MDSKSKVSQVIPDAPDAQKEIIAAAIDSAVDPIYGPVDAYLREHAKARAARLAKSSPSKSN